MSRLAMTALSIALLVPPAHAVDGLIALPSVHPAKQSIDKLEALAPSRGLRIFARIDHAAGARSIEQPLRPTELLIFGHPRGGTPLLQCAQTFGIDLPLHVLAWEDAAGKSWLGYRNPAAAVNDLSNPACDAAYKRLMSTLDALVREAAGT